MPHNLDETTQKIILTVSTFTTAVIAVPALIGQFRLVPNLKRRLAAQSDEKKRPSLFLGCLGFLVLMFSATVIFTLPILYLEHQQDDELAAVEQSSSINFCEEDFRHTPYIAEPANVISSLTCYVPLALLGLFGPPSTQYKREKRFITIYATLLAIGVGSGALHGLLTAEAQGGDELPMLWYTASTAFCALDIILARWTKQQEQRTKFLALLVILSAVAATVTYVARREDFTIFYIIFSLYSQTMVVSVVWICFGINWEKTKQKEAGIHFKATVLFPLAIASGWTTILAIWVWVSEMLYCNRVMHDRAFGEVIAPFVWNRVIHPMWHALSGLLAYLLVQVLVAARGMQQNWGTPSIAWFGAPYVVFSQQQTGKKVD